MKHQKMRLSDMHDAGIEYFAFSRIRNADGVYGYRYVLDRPLSEAQRKIIGTYKNTIISSCRYRYAPEIKHETLIILDKCIKAVTA